MNAITFGQTYIPSTNTRFGQASMNFGSYSQPDSVQFGYRPFQFDPRPSKPMPLWQKIGLGVIGATVFYLKCC